MMRLLTFVRDRARGAVIAGLRPPKPPVVVQPQPDGAKFTIVCEYVVVKLPDK